MANLKLIIAYDGTDYLGWQKTKMGPSIEETLENALSTALREPITLQAASRTDRGVHAEGQVINFFTSTSPDLYRLKRSLNGLLPKELSLLHIETTTATFHPTLDCIGKEYHYEICLDAVQLPFHRRFSWHFPYSVDLTAIEKAIPHLIGKHDFSAFSNENGLEKEDTIRELYRITLHPLPHNRLRIEVFGNRFLYKMVRNLVGTLLYVGCGKLSAEDLPAILESKKRTRAGVTAPAHGLSLKQVIYS
jgi:tRNA pseudouridine38-40 synthase